MEKVKLKLPSDELGVLKLYFVQIKATAKQEDLTIDVVAVGHKATLC